VLLGDDVRADDVGRHEIGRELDARELRVDRLGERAHEHRLAEAGHTLEQRVTAAEETHQHALDDLLLADDHGPDLFAQLAQIGGEFRDGSLDVTRGSRSHDAHFPFGASSAVPPAASVFSALGWIFAK
jgi:hypothetical protein